MKQSTACMPGLGVWFAALLVLAALVLSRAAHAESVMLQSSSPGAHGMLNTQFLISTDEGLTYVSGLSVLEGGFRRYIGYLVRRGVLSFTVEPITWQMDGDALVPGSLVSIGRRLTGRIGRSVKAPVPEDADGQAANLSRTGGVVVGFYDNGAFTPYHAFYSLGGADPFDIGTLDPVNNANRSSFATDVSDNGATIVGYSDTVGGATIVGESDFPGGFSGTVRQAFRWTAATGMVSLGSILPNWHSIATAVSADGQTVVGKSGVPFGNVNRDRAFRWNTAEGLRDLGVLPGFESSVATATNDSGSIVVGMLIPSSPASNGQAGGGFIHSSTTRAFYWTAAGGMKELSTLLTARGADLSGTQLLTATGISPDGQYISGISRHTVNGVAEERAFLVKLCGPEISGPCHPAQVAQPPAGAGYALAAASTALSVAAGQAASTTVTISPSGGFTGQVSFARSNLPASAACNFSPQQVTVSGGAASTTLTISTSGAAVARAPGPKHDSRLAGGAPATLGAGVFIACGWLAGRRRRGDVLPVLLALVLVGALVAGCGGGVGGDGSASGGAANPPSGTPAGTFPVTVTATSGSSATAVTRSMVVTLSVTR